MANIYAWVQCDVMKYLELNCIYILYKFTVSGVLNDHLMFAEHNNEL